MKLDQQAAANLPPGAMPGTVLIPATQRKAMQIQLQSQAQTSASQTKQLEEQRTVYQKLQFHHALLLAELESVQQHLPPAILQQHISAELTFLRTYTRELNSTITNLKTELMYLQAQNQHSATVLDNKHQQTILLHSQTQQLEQQQIALQFKDHKLYELEAQLQSRTREAQELKQLLSDAQQRLAALSHQAQQDNAALKQHNETLKQQAVQQLLSQQQQAQQAAAQAASIPPMHQPQSQQLPSSQPPIHPSYAPMQPYHPSHALYGPRIHPVILHPQRIMVATTSLQRVASIRPIHPVIPLLVAVAMTTKPATSIRIIIVVPPHLTFIRRHNHRTRIRIPPPSPTSHRRRTTFDSDHAARPHRRFPFATGPKSNDHMWKCRCACMHSVT
jgi:hypothetical protein